MYRATGDGTNRVLAMVRQIRRRWRARIAIRGMAIVLGAGLLAFLLSVYGLEVSRFSASSVMWFRGILWFVMAGLTARFLIWPLTRRVSDEQAALYLEENEPSLEASVLASLETASGADQASEALARQVVESALQRAQDIDFGRRIEQKGLYRTSGALAAGGTRLARVTALGTHSTPQRRSRPPVPDTGRRHSEPVFDFRESR